MRKRRSDLLVGVVILVAFVMLIGGIMWLKSFSFTQKMVSYTAVFSNIGGLQVGDPVSANGLKKGTVSSIELYGSLVAVRFKLDKTVPFTDSAVVTVKNIGLMGERKIEISLSDKGTLYIPDEKDNVSQYIKGNFDSGIAEAFGMIGDFMVDASGLVDSVSTLLAATLGSREFREFYYRTVIRLDTILDVVDRVLENNDDKVDYIVNSLQKTVKNIDVIITENKKGVKSIVTNTDSLTYRASDLMIELDTLLTDLRGISRKIERGKGTVGQLVNDSATINEVMKTLSKLDTLINEVEDYGLKLRIKLGHGDKKNKNKK